jgi:hypothetical protein
VYVEPKLAQVEAGEPVTCTIQLEDVSDLFGFQLRLYFDPHLLQVTDADPLTAGTQIEPSDIFAGLNTSFSVNSVNNATGEILYSEALLGEPDGVDGDYRLGTVVFDTVEEGVSALRFGVGPGKSRLAGPSGEIDAIWMGGRVVVGDYLVFLPFAAD